MKLDHVAIAVRSLERAQPLYEALLGKPTHAAETLPNEGVKVLFFDCAGVHVELMEPYGENSALEGSINKRGEGLHHLAYLVDSIDKTLKRLGVEPHGKIREGSRGTRICFIHPRETSGVLWELVEKKR